MGEWRVVNVGNGCEAHVDGHAERMFELGQRAEVRRRARRAGDGAIRGSGGGGGGGGGSGGGSGGGTFVRRPISLLERCGRDTSLLEKPGN